MRREPADSPGLLFLLEGRVPFLQTLKHVVKIYDFTVDQNTVHIKDHCFYNLKLSSCSFLSLFSGSDRYIPICLSGSDHLSGKRGCVMVQSHPASDSQFQRHTQINSI